MGTALSIMMRAAVYPASTALCCLYSLLALGLGDSGSRDGAEDAVTSKLESQTRFVRAGVDRSSRVHSDMRICSFARFGSRPQLISLRSDDRQSRRQSEGAAALLQTGTRALVGHREEGKFARRDTSIAVRPKLVLLALLTPELTPRYSQKFTAERARNT